jgi:2-polyprenyl-3-methyl-5-hydroxy-6-metoxy-1,4-benzoquinol methylase
MSHTKSHRKLASEMREAQLKKEQHEAPRRARLKAETTLAVAAFNVRALTQSPLTFYPTIGTAIAAHRFFVVCECPACGQQGSVDLRKVDRHPGASIESLADSYHDAFSANRAIEPLLKAAHVEHGTRLLDVATGPGTLAANAAERGAHVIGIDIAPAMDCAGAYTPSASRLSRQR